MRTRAFVLAAVVAVLMSCLPMPGAAQAANTFSARLGWVPTTPADRPNVTGKGTATAALSGTRLTISGSFEGLAGPATQARLHRGVAKGARGPAIGDLTLTQAVAGKLSGSVDLTPAQIEDLRRGRLYILLHTAKGMAPDGSTLWGWFE